MDTRFLKEKLAGVLLGTAVGDALGLPYEGLPARRMRKMLKKDRHGFLFGKGMISDDTEHTILVGNALLAHPHNVQGFAQDLSRSLRFWLAALPAGAGSATLRSILKMLVGVSPQKSGVFSAGNGPAMKSAIIGAFFHTRPHLMEPYIRAATLMTHRDPRALNGAMAVARLAAWAMPRNPDQPLEVDEVFRLLAMPEDSEWDALNTAMAAAYAQQHSVAHFAKTIGQEKGVGGYVYHTVPVAIYATLRHYGDFAATVRETIWCGGDTDTTAAIAGALAGALAGVGGIPDAWISGICDWPRGVPLLWDLAENLTKASQSQVAESPVRWPSLAVLPRNLFFLTIVLLHGFRRLAPPY